MGRNMPNVVGDELPQVSKPSPASALRDGPEAGETPVKATKEREGASAASLPACEKRVGGRHCAGFEMGNHKTCCNCGMNQHGEVPLDA